MHDRRFIRIRGEVTLRRDGKLLWHRRNLVVNACVSALANLTAGVSAGQFVSVVGFGSGNTAPTVNDTDLTASPKYYNAVAGYTFPSAGTVQFNYQLSPASDAAAEGIMIQELGLFSNSAAVAIPKLVSSGAGSGIPGPMWAHVVVPQFEFTSAGVFEGTWALTFYGAPMATLTDTPEFSFNEVYEIAATDPVEGASAGASFGGLGVDNAPHQSLANRTAYLFNNQVQNINKIAALLNFVARLTGALGTNGSWIAVPYTDVNLGAQTAYIQWGYATGPGSNPGLLTVNWPKRFPTACLGAFCSTFRNVSGANGTNHTASTSPTVGSFVFDTISTLPGQIGGWWIAVGN